MTRIRFDEEGHILISPAQFLAAAEADPIHLVEDVLCYGTPALCRTYGSYRTFIHNTAKALKVSPLSIWIRGSAHVGFSIAPRAGKVWTGVNNESDVDLAIVDPDHYHRLDVEIRDWGRSAPPEDFSRLKRLSESRRYYCYRHHDLPSTHTCDQYKSNIAKIAANIQRDITAFFYRDYWALHDRCTKDIRDLLSQNQIGLPEPKGDRRAAMWLKDAELGPSLCAAGRTELNLARKNNDHRMDITDRGLAALGGIGEVPRVWLDSCAIGDAGVSALGHSKQLEFLSLADTDISNAAIQMVSRQFPNLRTLVLDNTHVTFEAVKNFCSISTLTAISVRRCRWPQMNKVQFRNATNVPVRTRFDRSN